MIEYRREVVGLMLFRFSCRRGCPSCCVWRLVGSRLGYKLGRRLLLVSISKLVPFLLIPFIPLLPPLSHSPTLEIKQEGTTYPITSSPTPNPTLIIITPLPLPSPPHNIRERESLAQPTEDRGRTLFHWW